MSLHAWFGVHKADHQASRWQDGYFVSRCTLCGRDMVKPPGGEWRLRKGWTGGPA